MNKTQTQYPTQPNPATTDQVISKFGRYLYEDNGFGDDKFSDQRKDVAYTILGWELEPDEDTEWTGIYQPTGELLVIMVGDDHVWHFSPYDLTPIDDDDYCPGCGQIGCKAYSY